MFIKKMVDNGAAEDRGYKCKDWHSVAVLVFRKFILDFVMTG